MRTLIFLIIVMTGVTVCGCETDDDSNTDNVDDDEGDDDSAEERLSEIPLADRYSEVALIMRPHFAEADEELPFFGWELNGDYQIQTSIFSSPFSFKQLGDVIFTANYQGYGVYFSNDTYKIFKFSDPLAWEEVYFLENDNWLYGQLQLSSSEELVFCEGEAWTSRCTIKYLSDQIIIDESLPIVGDIFRFTHNGSGVVTDCENEEFYYRENRVDEWMAIDFPDDLETPPNYTTVLIDLELAPNGFWAIYNQYHEEDFYFSNSVYCRYRLGEEWKDCISINNQRTEYAFVDADESMVVFGSTRKQEQETGEYYLNFNHGVIAESGENSFVDVVFPLDLQPLDYGHIQTEPIRFALGNSNNAFLLVDYESEDVSGSAPSDGKLLYNYKNNDIYYVSDVQSLLDKFMSWSIYSIIIDP